MGHAVVATRGYDKRARKVFTPAERAAAELEIALAPHCLAGFLAGTGGARKGTGRPAARREVRRCAHHLLRALPAAGVLYLLDVYAKSAKEDLNEGENVKCSEGFIAALETES